MHMVRWKIWTKGKEVGGGVRGVGQSLIPLFNIQGYENVWLQHQELLLGPIAFVNFFLKIA
jgi:hypothetical protein